MTMTTGCRNKAGQFAKCHSRGAGGRRVEVPGIEKWTKFHLSHERRQHFAWLSLEGWRFDLYGTPKAPGSPYGAWNLHVQPPVGAGRGWKEGPFLSRDAAVDVARRIPEQHAGQPIGGARAWSPERERADLQRLQAQGHLQQGFNPVDYHFEWTGTGPGGWYTWDYAAGHKAARAARDAAAKRLKEQGYTVRKWSLPNQLITRGGIGSGHPQIENVVTVYMLNADRAPGRRSASDDPWWRAWAAARPAIKLLGLTPYGKGYEIQAQGPEGAFSIWQSASTSRADAEWVLARYKADEHMLRRNYGIAVSKSARFGQQPASGRGATGSRPSRYDFKIRVTDPDYPAETFVTTPPKYIRDNQGDPEVVRQMTELARRGPGAVLHVGGGAQGRWDIVRLPASGGRAEWLGPMPYTVWEFRSVDGKHRNVVVYNTQPGEADYQHEYQRILWQGPADNKQDALRRAKRLRG